jgi:DNA-binding protein HU-beta
MIRVAQSRAGPKEAVFIMSKQTLIDTLAAQGLSKKAAGEAVNAILETIAKTLKKEGKFGLVGFGTFTVRKRAARKGRNPATGDVIKIKASKSVGFKASSTLKAAI